MRLPVRTLQIPYRKEKKSNIFWPTMYLRRGNNCELIRPINRKFAGPYSFYVQIFLYTFINFTSKESFGVAALRNKPLQSVSFTTHI